MVPRDLKRKVLAECHEEQGRHLGQKKTLYRAYALYFWQNMHNDIVIYVICCYTCQQCKPTNKKPAGFMEKRTILTPWQKVASDCMRPFPRSKDGLIHILVFEDLFTKYIEVIPIKTKNAKAILKNFKNQVTYRHGFPEQLITDNGTEYINSSMQEFTENTGIIYKSSTRTSVS